MISVRRRHGRGGVLARLDANEGRRVISVCFRLDDPSPVGDKEVERNILDIFARRDIPLCVAAIPFARTADGGTILLSRQNASHLVDASREGTIEIISKWMNLHPAQASKVYDSVRDTFSKNGVPTEEQSKAYITMLSSTAGLKGEVSPASIFDFSLAMEAAKALAAKR